MGAGRKTRNRGLPDLGGFRSLQLSCNFRSMGAGRSFSLSLSHALYFMEQSESGDAVKPLVAGMNKTKANETKHSYV